MQIVYMRPSDTGPQGPVPWGPELVGPAMKPQTGLQLIAEGSAISWSQTNPLW